MLIREVSDALLDGSNLLKGLLNQKIDVIGIQEKPISETHSAVMIIQRNGSREYFGVVVSRIEESKYSELKENIGRK